MLYITKGFLILDATYEEPLYDEHPDIATKFTDVKVFVAALSGIELDENGTVTWVDVENECFGVSVHPGVLTIKTNLLQKIGTDIVPVEHIVYERISSCKRALMELYSKEDELEAKIKFLEEDSSCLLQQCLDADYFLTHEEYGNASEQLFINASSASSLKCLLLQCRLHIKEAYNTFSYLTAQYRKGGN